MVRLIAALLHCLAPGLARCADRYIHLAPLSVLTANAPPRRLSSSLAVGTLARIVAASGPPRETVEEDPHLYGGHGDVAMLRGRNDTWYNFLSTSNLSIGVLFMHDNFVWRHKTVHGSWMKALAITATTRRNGTFRAYYHVDTPKTSTISVSMSIGKSQSSSPVVHPILAGEELDLDGIQHRLTRDETFSLSNGAWMIEASNRLLPYKSVDVAKPKRRLDLTVRPVGNVDHDPIAPHGIIGQTYDRDDSKVVGAPATPNDPGAAPEARAMAEGAIEGEAADYEIDHADPFSTVFKYSRFGLTGHAPPRNISALSGAILPATMGVAGALTDEPDGDALEKEQL